MSLSRMRVGSVRPGDCDVGVESLEDEGGVVRESWVRDGERRRRWFDDVRVKVLGLVSVFEGEVLEEGVCGERS